MILPLMKMLNAWTITNAILFVFNKPLTLGSKYFLLLCTFKTLICRFETILAHSKHLKNVLSHWANINKIFCVKFENTKHLGVLC